MTPSQFIDRAAAVLLIVLTALFALREWGAGEPGPVIEGLVIVILVLLAVNVRLTRKAFVVVGLVLTAWVALSADDWLSLARQGLEKAAFVATLQTMLRNIRKHDF